MTSPLPARRLARAFVLCSLLPAACGPAPSASAPSSPAAPSASAATGPGAAAPARASELPDGVDLLITLAPEPSPAPLVRVTIVARVDAPEGGQAPSEPARAGANPLGAWESERPLDLVEPPRASDAIGAVSVTVTPSAEATRVTLNSAPRGVARLAYAVRASLPAYPDPPAIALDPDRFEGAGEALLMIPEALRERAVRAVIRIETDEIGAAELVGAATSFGHGARVETTARGADLRGGLFVGGLLGRAMFRAPEGNDEAAWLGYTAFDPRPVFADMAGLRTSLRQIFGAPDADKVTFLFLSDSRPPGSFVVTRRPRSVVARIGVQEPWTAPVRIAVAAAVVHGWIGARLWVGPDDRAREAEAYWFTEGVTRHLARDLLFRYGLISPADAAAEVEGLAAVLATSDAASLPNQELARKPKGALPVLVARGALAALRADALIRARTGHKRSLENVLRELYQEAAAKKGALPATAWVDHLVNDLGEKERAVYKDTIELGKPVDLPDGALGPCFRRVTRTYAGFDLGFDEEASMNASPRRVTGLVKGGPADRAGVREGEQIVALMVGARSASEPVRITLVRLEDMKTRTLSYKPAGRSGKGVGFERKRDVPDEECTK